MNSHDFDAARQELEELGRRIQRLKDRSIDNSPEQPKRARPKRPRPKTLPSSKPPRRTPKVPAWVSALPYSLRTRPTVESIQSHFRSHRINGRWAAVRWAFLAVAIGFADGWPFSANDWILAFTTLLLVVCLCMSPSPPTEKIREFVRARIPSAASPDAAL